jgi:hypothetical protein
MAGNGTRRNAVPIADLAQSVLDPVLQRRAGLSVALLQSWEEIVGQRLAAASRPERLVWPRRHDEDEPFRPATLIVACEGAAALTLQHETGELIQRLNAFLGFPAIGRVRIVQKPVARQAVDPPPSPQPLSADEEARLSRMLTNVEDADLRHALESLGRAVLSASRRR